MDINTKLDRSSLLRLIAQHPLDGLNEAERLFKQGGHSGDDRAWLLKLIILRFGGAKFYVRTQGFFLGLIAGQMLTIGLWLIVDYFTGHNGNFLFAW